MSISVNTLLTTSTSDSDSNWMSSAHGAVVLPIKLRSLPSPNVFKKWHPLKESNFPSRIWSPTRLTLEHWRILNGSLCRCCPGYSWVKVRWLSWLSNRPLNWRFSEDLNPKLNVRSVAWYIHFHHRSINWGDIRVLPSFLKFHKLRC